MKFKIKKSIIYLGLLSIVNLYSSSYIIKLDKKSGISIKSSVEYDSNGFNSEGIHKKTLTEYNEEGYNVNGYNDSGYDTEGYIEPNLVKGSYKNQRSGSNCSGASFTSDSRNIATNVTALGLGSNYCTTRYTYTLLDKTKIKKVMISNLKRAGDINDKATIIINAFGINLPIPKTSDVMNYEFDVNVVLNQGYSLEYLNSAYADSRYTYKISFK
jgi:hypothetical protein